MFRQSRKKRLQERKVDTVEINRNATYPHRLSFYTTPPLQELTLEEFETWAIDRLKVLGEIESCQLRNKTLQEMETHMKTVIDKHMPLATGAGGAAAIDDERKKDHYSHFILRLAFCRSAELRERFVRLETALFKMRYNSDSVQQRQQFVDALDFPWEPVDAEELQEMEPLLSWHGNNVKEFFKVDFEKVPELVSNRMVSLYQGKAYIPSTLQLTLVASDFQDKLMRDLEMTARVIPRLDEDDRLVPILNHLALGMPAPTYNTPRNGEEIKADQVDGLARNNHFPLCMKHMHMTAMDNHHAYYDVRQQYGGFLKGIGLSVDESLLFWRKVFGRMTDDEFRKKYAYNIRHMYGLEGSRIDFKPMDCIQITKSQGSGDHGCPYRSFSQANLDTALGKMGITEKHDLANIHHLVSEKKYHVACTQVYELTHKTDQTEYKESIVHPNVYFDRSFAQLKLNTNSQPQSQGAEAAASSQPAQDHGQVHDQAQQQTQTQESEVPASGNDIVQE